MYFVLIYQIHWYRRLFNTFGLNENVTTSSPTDSNPSKGMLNPSGCPNTNHPKSNENVTDTSLEAEISDTSIGQSSLPKKHKQNLSPPLPSSNQISKNFSVYKKLRRVESSALENCAAKKLQVNLAIDITLTSTNFSEGTSSMTLCSDCSTSP